MQGQVDFDSWNRRRGVVEWRDTPFQCVQCDCEATGREMHWRVVIPPTGWISVYTYPPGDDGLYFVCSEKCAIEWVIEKEDER